MASRIILSFGLLIWLSGVSGCTDAKRLAYEGFGRDEWQHPDEVIRALAIQPGDDVADLGAGSGYFTFRLADAVGPNGKVFAVDIDADMNEALAGRVLEKGYQNIDVILAQPDDPVLPEHSLDLLFTSNTYHHLEDRVAYFSHVQKYLKPEGRVAIIDFKKDGILQMSGHYTSGTVIQRQMKEAGYILDQALDFLPKQTFLVFSIPHSLKP